MTQLASKIVRYDMDARIFTPTTFGFLVPLALRNMLAEHLWTIGLIDSGMPLASWFKIRSVLNYIEFELTMEITK